MRNEGHVTKAVFGRFPERCGEQTPTQWAMGFCFAVRRSCVERWQLRFDEHLQYYAYAEDLDFTYRYYKYATKEKMLCFFSNQFVVTHQASQEYRTPTRQATFFYVLNRYYLSKKLFGTLSSRLWASWSNIGTMIMMKLHHEPAKDVVDAMRFYRRYSKDINQGIMHYEEFVR